MNTYRMKKASVWLGFVAVMGLRPVLGFAAPATPRVDDAGVTGRIAYEVDGDIWVMDVVN